MAPFWQSLLGPPKFSLANMSALHQLLQRTSVVSERNRAMVVDALRTTAELVLWGDQNDPTLFEFFLEKNILGIFWRLLEQRDTPSSVKVQILQTLSILISNIEAGPSIYYILSNDHINELIRHPFDFSNEELLAHYVSLLKAIALRLDPHTVQFFIGDAPPTSGARDAGNSSGSAPPPTDASPAAAVRSPSGGVPSSLSAAAPPARRPGGDPPPPPRRPPSDPPTQPPARFALFEAALTLWTNEERMVRTAVRAIVLCVCRLEEPRVQAFVRDSAVLPQVLVAALCAEHGKIGDAICACYAASATHRCADPSAGSPGPHDPALPRHGAASPLVGAVDAALQGLLDETYFLNDLLESAQPGLATRLVSALLSGFVMPLLVQPLVPGHSMGAVSRQHVQAQAVSAADAPGQAASGAGASWGSSTPEGVGGHPPADPCTVPELLALLLMAVCVSTVSHAPLLGALATLFLHPQLKLSSVVTPPDAPCVLPLFDDQARQPLDDQQNSWRRGSGAAERQAARTVPGTGELAAGSGEGVGQGAPRMGAAGWQERNALRSSLLARLESRDERMVLLSCACVLSAMRAPAVHSETLRQAFLLPVRRVRASCLLERLLATRAPGPEAEPSPAHLSPGAPGTERAALRPASRSCLGAWGVLGTPAGAAAGKDPASAGAEYSEAAVAALLGVLSRAAAGHAADGAAGRSSAGGREGVGGGDVGLGGGSPRPSLQPGAGSDGCGVRLLMVQLAIEVLLELLGGSHGPAPLQPHHLRALEHAHEAAEAAVRRSLHGRYASEIGGLAEYEHAQMPRQGAGSGMKLVGVLADPSILLPASLLPHLPLGRRHARTELEASRVVLQTFLLLRQLRNELTSTPDDLASLAPPLPVDLQRGARLDLDRAAQLVPCEMPGRAAEHPVSCLLVLPLLEPTEPPLDPQASWTRRGFLLLVAPWPALEQEQQPPPVPPPPPPVDPPPLPGGILPGMASQGPPPVPMPARLPSTQAQRVPVQQARVVLALPLSALRIERETPTASHLAVLVTRPLVARDGCGAEGGRAEHILSFREPWRCSIAKAHLERASAAVRIEQKQRLAALLGPPSSATRR